jgi:hypothetical protein
MVIASASVDGDVTVSAKADSGIKAEHGDDERESNGDGRGGVASNDHGGSTFTKLSPVRQIIATC